MNLQNAHASKVKIVENEDYERQYPAHSLARVTLTLNNGKTLSAEVDRSERGRYLTPTDADIEEKTRLLATPVLGEAKTERGRVDVQKEVFWSRDLLWFRAEGPGARLDLPLEVMTVERDRDLGARRRRLLAVDLGHPAEHEEQD